MKRNQTFGLSRAQKMVNSIINEDFNLENNQDVPFENENQETEYPGKTCYVVFYCIYYILLGSY